MQYQKVRLSLGNSSSLLTIFKLVSSANKCFPTLTIMCEQFKCGVHFAAIEIHSRTIRSQFLHISGLTRLNMENALLDKEETININYMALNFQEEIRSFIRSLLNVELKHDLMSEEAYHTCSYLNN